MASNIKILNVEYTQSIQYFNYPLGQGSGYAPDNSIPLVNRKSTILRVYVDTRQNDPNVPVPARVDGIVWAFNPVTGRGAVYNSLGAVTARQVETITRANFGHTLNFLLPWQLCDTNVLCEIAIFDPNDRSSQNANVKFLSLDFINLPPLDLHTVMIHYTGVDFFDKPVDQRTDGIDVLATLDYILRTYPVSDFNFDGCELLDWNLKLAVTANFYALYNTLNDMRGMSGTDDVYLGLIPGAAGCGGVCGLGGGGTALSFASGTLDDPNASHEMGHALGRAHTPQCTAGDNNYPQYNGYPRDSIGECGVDTRKLVVFAPATAVDYMSYCAGPIWTSPYGYLAIMNALKSGSFSSGNTGALSSSSVWRAPKIDCYYLGFRIHRPDPNVRVTMRTAFHLLRTPPRLAISRETEVTLELVDANDQLLFNAPCFSDNHNDESLPFQDFTVFAPNYSGLHALRIVKAGAVIAEYKITKQPPRITNVTMKPRDSSHGEFVRLSWTGTADSNADPPLQYGVRFSNDGEKWRPVAVSTTGTEIVVDMSVLPGGDKCRFQIVASAGFRTAAEETSTFQSKRKPRELYILSPSDGMEVELAVPIAFVGTGFSADFGNARSEEITWMSSEGQLIGVGQQCTVTSLPVGTHVITMRVPNGVGDFAAKTVRLKVVPRKPCPDDQESDRQQNFNIWKQHCGCRH